MAEQQTEQTPQSSPVVQPGETVTASVDPTTGKLTTVPQTVNVSDTLPPSIRNIRQTAQEREIVKTAPDMIVYLDGLPYLINHYLNDPQSNQQFIIVPFNEKVQTFNVSYDTDNLVPSGSIHLSVPNHEKKFYQMPGGNNLITSMMEVQVFSKGYFLSPRGNTLYHRVFKGVSSHVNHTDNGKTLEIDIQIRGVLRFLEMMQIDVAPALQSNSNQNVTPYTSIQYNMDPYQQIADTILRGLSLDQFQLNQIANADQTIKGSQWEDAVKSQYIAKWQSKLNGVLADTHIMGYIFGSAPQKFDLVTKDSPVKDKKDSLYQAAAIARAGKLAETDQSNFTFVNMIRGYTPDFGIGSVQLSNGRITPRLERIRTILHHIGFEGFQDINGEIIFKAPLYNLDVTNLAAAPAPKDTTQHSQFDDVTDQNNPFVVFLPEIENETENEDESAIQATRLSIQGTWSRTLQFSVNQVVRAATSHIDIPKLARFGLREAPARTVNWISESDKFLLYAYAVNELVRSNRGWRTYTFTMPIRPELRLGFPMYIPHKDMYGYIKNCSINYSYGQAATMTVMLDSIRKRPMFPTTRQMAGTKDPNNPDQPLKETILVTQPNLVMKWTNPPAKTSSATKNSGSTTARPSPSGDDPSNNPDVNFEGNSATLPRADGTPQLNPEAVQFSNYRKQQIGTDWQTRTDTDTHSYRVQNDVFYGGTRGALPIKNTTGSGQPYFSRDNWLGPQADGSTGINGNYIQTIVNMQPYTDEKGYEVVGVWPFGRWKSVAEAYKETRDGKIVDYVHPQDQEILKKQDALLFAGLGTPSYDAAGTLIAKFNSLTSAVYSNSTFELAYPSEKNAPPVFGPQPVDTNLLQLQQPDNQPGPISDLALLTTTVGDVQQTVDMMLSGTPQPLQKTKQELKITQDNTDSPIDFSTVVSDFKQLGKTSG